MPGTVVVFGALWFWVQTLFGTSMCVFSVSLLSCTNRGLTMGRSLTQGVLEMCINKINKLGKLETLDCLGLKLQSETTPSAAVGILLFIRGVIKQVVLIIKADHSY